MAGEIPKSFDAATDRLETLSARFYEDSEGSETYEATVVVPRELTPAERAEESRAVDHSLLPDKIAKGLGEN